MIKKIGAEVKSILFEGLFEDKENSNFYTQLLFLINSTLPFYLVYVKEHGKRPSTFPSPLSSAEDGLRFLFEEIWSKRYVKQIGIEEWVLTEEGESAVRGLEPHASESDKRQLRRISQG